MKLVIDDCLSYESSDVLVFGIGHQANDRNWLLYPIAPEKRQMFEERLYLNRTFEHIVRIDFSSSDDLTYNIGNDLDALIDWIIDSGMGPWSFTLEHRREHTVYEVIFSFEDLTTATNFKVNF